MKHQPISAAQPLITKPGAYPDIPAELYHGTEICPAPSISSTGLKTILNRSPAHYWHGSNLNPNRADQEEKRHFAVGKAAHDMLLLSDRWPEHYFVTPEGFSAAHHKKWAEVMPAYEAAMADPAVTIIKHEDEIQVRLMCAQLLKNESAVALLTNGEPEVTLAWQDEETGVWLRARPDFLPHKRRFIGDLKTAADASPDAFQRSIANLGYHQSAALYLDGIEAVYGDKPQAWLHVVMEKTEPFLPAIYQLPAEDIERGRVLNRRAIRHFAKCLNDDHWPGYADEPTELGLPQWSRKTIDEMPLTDTPEGDE